MENYLLLIVGILLSVLGAVNIKGNIRTIHACNRRRRGHPEIRPRRRHGNAHHRRFARRGVFCFPAE